MKKRRNYLANLLPVLLSLFLLLSALSFYVYAEGTEPTTNEEIPPTTSAPESEDLPPLPTNTVSLIAPEVIRPGDTVEFSFLCDAADTRAIQGSLMFDPALLSYVGSDERLDDWKFTFSREEGTLKYLGLSSENRPAQGNTPLFSATFQVNEAVPAGTLLLFTVSDTTAYDGTSEITLTGGDFSFPVSRALSSECTLTSLSIKGGNLSPAFSPEITEYSVNLPYTSMLAEINATACEYGELKYSSQDLMIGDNVITVTVISETGLQQVYTIHVNRAADPNYVPSTDNRILSLELSDGLLFPSFSPEITEYTLYMVQGHDLVITPNAAPKAVADGLFIRVNEVSETQDGESTAGTYTIICYAEDGTPRTYTFHTILLSSPKKPEENQKKPEQPSNIVPIVIGIVAFVSVAIFFIGFVMGTVLRSKKKKEKSTVPIADSPAIVPLGSSSEQALPPAVPSPAEPTETPAEEPTEAPSDSPSEESPEPPSDTTSEATSDTPAQTAEQVAESANTSSKKRKKKKKKKH